MSALGETAIKAAGTGVEPCDLTRVSSWLWAEAESNVGPIPQQSRSDEEKPLRGVSDPSQWAVPWPVSCATFREPRWPAERAELLVDPNSVPAQQGARAKHGAATSPAASSRTIGNTTERRQLFTEAVFAR